MKKFLLLCSAFFICCEDAESINIKYLKDNGYKEITCQTVESYQTEESSFIEINRKFDVNKDFTTFEYLGNTGSVAMPITMAIGIEKGAFEPGQRAVLMGIGSGLVCTMYSVLWEAGA